MSTNEPFQPFPEDSARADWAAAQQAPPEQPPSIKTAVLLMRMGAGLALIGAFITVIQIANGSVKDGVRDDLRDSKPNFTQSDLDSQYAALVGYSLVAVVIGIGLWLWMAWANGKGLKWARIVATVLGVLNVVLVLAGLVGGQSTGVSIIFSLLSVLVAIGTVWYLYRPESNQFFDARSARA